MAQLIGRGEARMASATALIHLYTLPEHDELTIWARMALGSSHLPSIADLQTGDMKPTTQEPLDDVDQSDPALP